MSSGFGILVVVIGLLVSVAIHEAGHMLVARRFGVPINEFAIGFGPLLASTTSGKGTQYSLRAIPLGGYVRIAGMFAPPKPGTPVRNRRGKKTLAQEAREASAAELTRDTQHRAFYHLSARRKVAVMVAGPVTNLLLAFVLLVTAMVGIGQRTAEPEIAEFATTVPTANGAVPGPGLEADFFTGDIVRAVDGQPIATWEEFRQKVRASPEQTLIVTVERGDAMVDVELTPARGESGRGVIGVRPATDYLSASPTEVAQAFWAMGKGTAALIVRLPQAVWQVAVSLVTDEPRDSGGLVSVVGVGRIAAEVTGDGAKQLGISQARETWWTLLMLLASLNMALFVFNLIPLPPLDGGHILGATYEGGRRLVEKKRGRGDPGPADTARMMPLTYAVALCLLAMTLVLVTADIVKPITLG